MNDTELTDAERDILLTRCDCSHTINDHGSIGHCWACLDDGRPDCDHDFEDLLAVRVARIVAARVAAAHADAWDQGFERAEYMARCWGHTDHWGEEDPYPTNPYRAAVAVPEPGNQP